MINKLIEQIGGRERLEELASFKPSGSNSVNSASREEWMAMASALLAVLNAKPAGEPSLDSIDNLELELGTKFHTTPPAPSVPEGWKLVPLEPTQRMIDAHTEGMVSGGATRAYRDMLAAAPSPGEK